MRLALSGSALVHAAILGVAVVGFVWPVAEDAAAPAPVTVNIVSMSAVASNSSEVIDSTATLSAVSAGSTATSVTPLLPQPVEPETTSDAPLRPPSVEPLPPDPVETVTGEPLDASMSETAEATPGETVEAAERLTQQAAAVDTLAVAELTSSAVDTVRSVAVTPVSAEKAEAPAAAPSVEPVSVTDLKVAPVPRTLSFERPSKPTAVTPPPQRQATTQPREEAPRRQQAPPSQQGNGGTSDADAVASAGAASQQSNNGAGGEAAVAQYGSQVRNKVMRAARGRERGEVVVRFTVQANGQVSGLAVSQSSGNPGVDGAGLAAVQRAAPFPPIPPAAGRDSWTFDVPLAFGR